MGVALLLIEIGFPVLTLEGALGVTPLPRRLTKFRAASATT